MINLGSKDYGVGWKLIRRWAFSSIHWTRRFQVGLLICVEIPLIRLLRRVAHLSLRFCEITDADADRLANALGNPSTHNWRLLTLCLTGNRIGDNGAKSLATVSSIRRSSLGSSDVRFCLGTAIQSDVDFVESLIEFHYGQRCLCFRIGPWAPWRMFMSLVRVGEFRFCEKWFWPTRKSFNDDIC